MDRGKSKTAGECLENRERFSSLRLIDRLPNTRFQDRRIMRDRATINC